MNSKQNLNLRKKTSVLDIKKLPQSASSQLSLQLGIYFDSIFESTYKSLGSIDFDYYSKEDPNFILRVQQVEWMFSAQVVFDLDDDTVFLAILIFDKILSKKQTVGSEISKLARVALVLASKQNEVVPLKLAQINQISMVSFTKSEYTDLEAEVLDILGFQLPQGTIYELFKLYQILFKLDSVLEKDATKALLKRCVLDYKLLSCGPKAAALAAITHMCCLQRILINTSVINDSCPSYTLALQTMDESATEVKHRRKRAAPEAQQVICI